MQAQELQQSSFAIIGCAGAAFSSFYQAVEDARQGDFAGADILMAQGAAQLSEAHRAQVAMLAEPDGANLDLMAVHGQDHLMTTILYQRIAGQLIGILWDLQPRQA